MNNNSNQEQNTQNMTGRARIWSTNNSSSGGDKAQTAPIKVPEERPYRRRIKPPPDKVHHLQPARFRRFVQRHTCRFQLPQHQQANVPPPGSNSDDAAAAPSTTTSAAATQQVLQPPPDAAIGGSSDPSTGAGCLDVTRKSMQEAYIAWCSSNDIPLSPGTMAELQPPS